MLVIAAASCTASWHYDVTCIGLDAMHVMTPGISVMLFKMCVNTKGTGQTPLTCHAIQLA